MHNTRRLVQWFAGGATAPTRTLCFLRPRWQKAGLLAGIVLAILPVIVSLLLRVGGLAMLIVFLALGWLAIAGPYLLAIVGVGIIVVGCGLWYERRDPVSVQLFAIGCGIAGAGFAMLRYCSAIAQWFSSVGYGVSSLVTTQLAAPLIEMWSQNRLWLWAGCVPVAFWVMWLLTVLMIKALALSNTVFLWYQHIQLRCPQCGGHLLPVCTGCDSTQRSLGPSSQGIFRKRCESTDRCTCSLPTLLYTWKRKVLAQRCEKCQAVAHSQFGRLPEYHVHVWTDSEVLRDRWRRQPPPESASECQTDLRGTPRWLSWLVGSGAKQSLVCLHCPPLEVCTTDGLSPSHPVDLVVALVPLDPAVVEGPGTIAGPQRLAPLVNRLDRTSPLGTQSRSNVPVVIWLEEPLQDEEVNVVNRRAELIESLVCSRVTNAAVLRGRSLIAEEFEQVSEQICDFVTRHGRLRVHEMNQQGRAKRVPNAFSPVP